MSELYVGGSYQDSKKRLEYLQSAMEVSLHEKDIEVSFPSFSYSNSLSLSNIFPLTIIIIYIEHDENWSHFL